MSEEVKASETTVTTPEQTAEQRQETERTFTQAEVDNIVNNRLWKERAKYSDYDDLKAKAESADQNKTALETALNQAKTLQEQLDALTAANEERALRERIAEETGVPANLLRGNSEDDLKAQAAAILSFTNSKQSYPSVKDGGETGAPAINKSEILGIKDEAARLRAIKEHIELFQ